MEQINNSTPLDQGFLFIDPSKIQVETLRSLAREFILRESGNDAPSDSDLDVTVENALKRIYRKDLLITFNSFDQSVGIACAKQFLSQ